jgi:hypothetical protein
LVTLQPEGSLSKAGPPALLNFLRNWLPNATDGEVIDELRKTAKRKASSILLFRVQREEVQRINQEL